MIFGDKILNYWDDILADLTEIIAIPSVSSDPEGIYPFGKDAASAVDCAMAMADKYGLKAKNVDYYAMHAEIGEGDGNAVVMAHIDVVPAGDGWDTDPYTCVIKDGKAFGRGVLDDKGAAIVALHCLRALRDEGVKGKRKLRVILGSSEETGMTDMEHYFDSEQKPDMGFTPDGEYGVCNCEKGILTYTASGKNDSRLIKSFQSGTVSNAVPDKARCELALNAEEFEKLSAFAETAEGKYEIEKTADGASILSLGTASHAAMPETGVNAASFLVKLLGDCFGGDALGSFFGHMYQKINITHDGSRIGVAMKDEESGALTFNLGIVTADENNCSLTVNIRYPATKDGDAISRKLQEETEAFSLTYTLLSDSKPLYVPRDSQLVELLSGAYEAVTGEKCDIYSMGGGTYAREMFGKGVAFGPTFPAHPDGTAHTANEFIYLDNLKQHARICLEAMYRMYTAN